jgi:hypothetical protein
MATDLQHQHAIEIASAAVDTFIEHLNAWVGDDGLHTDSTAPYQWEHCFNDRPRNLNLLRFVRSEMRWWGFPDEDFGAVYSIASKMFNRFGLSTH